MPSSPPTWETYPPVPALDCDLREPLPVPADLAARHPAILAVREWQAWHAGLVFLAEALSILDQGKPCRLERATDAYTPGQPWESALTLTTGQLSITLRWGEEPSGSAATDAPAGPGPAGTRPFCRVTTSGFLPHEQLLWSSSFSGETSGLTICFCHFREDAIEAIKTLAGRLFAKATPSTTTPASPTTG